jgi:hypothetical protein
MTGHPRTRPDFSPRCSCFPRRLWRKPPETAGSKTGGRDGRENPSGEVAVPIAPHHDRPLHGGVPRPIDAPESRGFCATASATSGRLRRPPPGARSGRTAGAVGRARTTPASVAMEKRPNRRQERSIPGGRRDPGSAARSRPPADRPGGRHGLSVRSCSVTTERPITSANSAATRFTTDSAASESSPTEPVSAHASVLSVIVASAAATDSHSSRASGGRALVAIISAGVRGRGPSASSAT